MKRSYGNNKSSGFFLKLGLVFLIPIGVLVVVASSDIEPNQEKVTKVLDNAQFYNKSK